MTRVMGFRSDPTSARYAVIHYDGTRFSMVNQASENRLVFPADLEEASEKILWLYREIERIFHADSTIERVVIKTNEFVGSETGARRTSSYLESAVMLFCEQKQIPVTTKTYASLGSSSKAAKDDAESRVGRTAKYWDGKIADAILAAWWGARQ